MVGGELMRIVIFCLTLGFSRRKVQLGQP